MYYLHPRLSLVRFLIIAMGLILLTAEESHSRCVCIREVGKQSIHPFLHIVDWLNNVEGILDSSATCSFC